ncbi:MAG: twin-arginine translocation signal domain-containing protein, partial [Propylenella sp.]
MSASFFPRLTRRSLLAGAGIAAASALPWPRSARAALVTEVKL